MSYSSQGSRLSLAQAQGLIVPYKFLSDKFEEPETHSPSASRNPQNALSSLSSLLNLLDAFPQGKVYLDPL